MNNCKKIYLAIDLKSFYASVECVERGLDPLTTHLVVADESKSSKTICLAVSPSLKQYGISGRARLFEVIQKINKVNLQRQRQLYGKKFRGESYDQQALQQFKNLKVNFIIASPRMSFYIDYSAKIYEVYLKYVAPEDIHVYSIDEVFIDITHYLNTQQLTAREFAKMIILDILKTTGITATAGVGTNLYLAKVAMDIMAKHIQPDQDGVRIAQLNERRYRQYLWSHRPITDFWRVGKGYAKRLSNEGIYTMGDIAKCSVGKDDEYYNEHLLYDMFGVNAELLIDHAWGYESCTIQDIKAYKPLNNSLGRGQVLSYPYPFLKARIVVEEMVDGLALELVEHQLVTNQIVIHVGYDKDNLKDNYFYKGEIDIDRYGRKIPKQAHSTIKLDQYTSSSKLMIQAVLKWFDHNVNQNLTIRRLNISANHVIDEKSVQHLQQHQQLDLFSNYEYIKEQEQQLQLNLEKEKKLQKVTLEIKKKYGKNAVLKVMNLEEGSTAIQRNQTIGGHKA